MMEELMELLTEMKPDVDFETCTTLVDDGELTSLDMVTLVSEIMQEFDVQIPADQIIPENFNSAEAIFALIQRMEEE